MIRDGYFWGESPIYVLHYDIHGMLALAEAALHYDGTDLYHYVSKQSGASIKSVIDGCIRMAYALERTGVGNGSMRLATYGDGSTCFDATGSLIDTFLVNPVGLGTARGKGMPTLSGELEIAYTRYKDPAYAWLLSLTPQRDTYLNYGRPTFGYCALTHGEPLPENPSPPAAPCGIYPSQGFAMLRADESPGYWTSGATTAMVRLGAAVGHGHEDYFGLVLHGKGRLLYPDVNVIQYEPTYLGWTHEGIAHSTILADHQSPRRCDSTTRSDFAPEAKFFAVAGSSFEGTRQVRAMLLTKEYLADVFRIADDRGRRHTFDWVLHGMGRLYMGNPSAYQPSTDLLAHYWWIDNEQSRASDIAWQADWVQHSGGAIPGQQAFGKEWFDQSIGVRMTMLGAKATQVYSGDGPMTDGPPHARIDGNPEGTIPLVLARRTGSAATFAALHDPYHTRPMIRQPRAIAQTDEAIAMAVEAEAFSDRVLIAYAPDTPCTLAGSDGEAFVFSDHAYVRLAGKELTVRGKLSAFRLRAGDVTLTINGQRQPVQRSGDFVIFGAPPQSAAPQQLAAADTKPEQQAALHYYTMPEEVHLSAGKEKEIELRLRCVGQGQAKGQLRFSPPPGIDVQPGIVDIPSMDEGEERIVAIRVKAAADAANALHTIAIDPVEATPAAPRKLLASVGVVMTEDRLRPRLAEFIIRAPRLHDGSR